MELNVVLIFRIIQAVLAIIVLGLAAHVASQDWEWHGSPGEVNFNIFNGVWTFFLVVPYLVLAPTYATPVAIPYVMLGVEVLTCLFWFAGFIAIASLIGGIPSSICGANSICAEMQATTVFGAFEFALFAATIALTFVVPKIRGRKTTTAEPTPGV